MSLPAGMRVAAGLLVLLLAAGCSSSEPKSTPEPTPSRAPQVELDFTLPSGMKEVEVPSSPPTQGMVYDITLYTGPDGCELRAVRLLLPKADGNEDIDASYTMLGAVMSSSGVDKFETTGLAIAGEPGPVPALAMEGSSTELELRAAGRLSNDSLQGFQVVYGCPKGRLQEDRWNHLVATITVDGFQGSLEQD